jgi:peroxiredoxin
MLRLHSTVLAAALLIATGCQSSSFTPEDRTRVTQLESLYSTGQAPEDAKFLEGRDPAGVPTKPRDPGPKGLDGDELVGRPLPMTRFIGAGGDVVDLSDWKGKKNVVLVILRGFSGAVCLSCTGQTLAIGENLKAFTERDAEVFFVYPGPKDSVPKFVDAVCDIRGSRESLPIELLLDIDLRVVREFKIEGKLAKPTTIILDPGRPASSATPHPSRARSRSVRHRRTSRRLAFPSSSSRASSGVEAWEPSTSDAPSTSTGPSP